jgi:hypothetical protein
MSKIYDLFTVALFVGTCWDIGVWYFVKGLDIYDEDTKPKNDATNEVISTSTVVPLNAENVLISSQNLDRNE